MGEPIKKEKRVIKTGEYHGILELIFRVDNWIRFIGLVCMGYAHFTETSVWKNEYLGEIQSDLILFILGILMTVFGPDARKILISRYQKPENTEFTE